MARACCDSSSPAVVMSFIAAFLLTFGWAFNVAAFSTCRFVSVSKGLFQDGELVTALGFYTIEGADGYCYVLNWNDWTQNIPYWTDKRMNSARICGGVAAFIAFVIMITSWFIPCCGGCGKGFRITIGFFAFVCSILAGLMFLINTSQVCGDGCEFAVGGGLTIGSILCYLIAAGLFCVASDPEPEEAFVPPAQNVGAEEDTAGGSKVITETPVANDKADPVDVEAKAY